MAASPYTSISPATKGVTLQGAPLEIDIKYQPVPGIYGYRRRDGANVEPSLEIRGLMLGVLGRSRSAGGLVGWDSDERPSDVYSRACEIVVESAATESCPLRLQAYWQIVNERVVDLQVLLSSNQPVAAAKVHTVTRLAADEVLSPIKKGESERQAFEDLRHVLPSKSEKLIFSQSSAGRGWLALGGPNRDADRVVLETPLLVFRLPDGKTSYVEMACVEDVGQLGITWHTEPAKREIETRFQLFRVPLEKGVILRTRLRAHLVPREGDLQEARQLYEQFTAEPPPLAA